MRPKSYISNVSPFIDNPTISILFHPPLNFDYQSRFSCKYWLELRLSSLFPSQGDIPLVIRQALLMRMMWVGDIILMVFTSTSHYLWGYLSCWATVCKQGTNFSWCLYWCSLRPLTVTLQQAPVWELIADIDWNCLLSKLLDFHCQYQIPRLILVEQQSYLYRWKIFKFKFIHL